MVGSQEVNIRQNGSTCQLAFDEFMGISVVWRWFEAAREPEKPISWFYYLKFPYPTANNLLVCSLVKTKNLQNHPFRIKILAKNVIFMIFDKLDNIKENLQVEVNLEVGVWSRHNVIYEADLR